MVAVSLRGSPAAQRSQLGDLARDYFSSFTPPSMERPDPMDQGRTP